MTFRGRSLGPVSYGRKVRKRVGRPLIAKVSETSGLIQTLTTPLSVQSWISFFSCLGSVIVYLLRAARVRHQGLDSVMEIAVPGNDLSGDH